MQVDYLSHLSHLIWLWRKQHLGIRSFRHKDLEDLFYDDTKKGIQPKHVNRLRLILDALDAGTNPQDLNFPDSNLHQLQPKKDNRWAVKVSGNWRVTFTFEKGEVYGVDYEDYH